MSSPSWPLTGRDDERAALRTAWRTPSCTGVVLTGAAGVGKSRLLLEFAAEAEAEGARVVRAMGSEATATIPLGALATMVPSGAWAVDRTEALVDLVVEALAADDRPVVVAADDVDQLDPLSREVLAAVVERRVAFLVATRRTDPDLPPRLLLPGVWEVELAPLDREQVGALLDAALGGVVAGEVAHQVFERTAGNALLVREVVVDALDGGSLVSEGGVWRFVGPVAGSPRLRELVADRLARLDPAGRTVLDVLAVAGPLTSVLADAVLEPDATADLAARALVWWDTQVDPPVLRVAHPVYGEVLLADLGVMGRRSIAARLASAASSLPRGAVDVLRLATWQLDAGGDIDPTVLVAAARRARRLSQLDLAERLLGVALARGGSVDALLLLGEVQFAGGRFADAEETYRDVESRLLDLLGAADGAGSTIAPALALAGIARGFNLAWGLGRAADALVAITAVHDALVSPDGDPGSSDPAADATVAREVAAEAASYLSISGRPAAGLVAADTVGFAGVRVEVRRQHARVLALIELGRVDDAVWAAEAGLAAVDGLPAGFGRDSFRCVFGVAHTEALAQCGRLDAASRSAAATYDDAVAAGHLSGQALAAWVRGRVELGRGHAERARRWLQESDVLERDLGPTGGRRRWAATGLVQAHAMAGDATAARGVLERIDAEDRAEPSDVVFLAGELERARAWVLAAAGDRSAAVEQLLARADAAWQADQPAVSVTALHDALVLGSGRPARRAARALVERASSMQGELAAARGDHARALLDDSGVDLARAASQFASLGALRLAAEVALTAARVMEEQGLASAATEERRRLAEWLEACGGEGAVARDVDWALRRLAPRQREVAQLAAAGLTNAEIAERLGRSLRTVENHLYRAYQELGVPGRRELAEVLRTT